MGNFIAFGVGALFVGFFVFIVTAEHYEQAALRAECVSARGHYYQIGDRRWNGLCVKADGILWERTQ